MKMERITETAWEKSAARKKIQEKSMSRKVRTVWAILWLSVSRCRPNRPQSLSRTGVRASPSTWYSPFRPPQITKEASAPCHRPLTRNTIILFRYFLAFPFRLPPRGI